MKKILLLSILICSLNASEIVENLEKGIIKSDLKVIKKVLKQQPVITYQDKDYLLNIAEKILKHREKIIHANHIKRRFDASDILPYSATVLIAGTLLSLDEEYESLLAKGISRIFLMGLSVYIATKIYKLGVTIPERRESEYQDALKIYGLIYQTPTID